MENVLQVYNDDDMATAAKSKEYRQRIGRALATHYKHTKWLVDVNIAGGIATISCPDISRLYGMTIHLTHSMEDTEAKAVRFGGELLERFRISRETGDTSRVKRDLKGDAIGLKEGGQ